MRKERLGTMVTIRNYLTILILMVLVFVMFMFAGVSSNILSDTTTNNQAGQRSSIYYSNTITADLLNMDQPDALSSAEERKLLEPGKKLHILILSQGTEDTISKILTEWCVYNKYLYRAERILPEKEEIADYDVVLFGDYRIRREDTGLLYAYSDLGITMIFTRLPDYQDISSDKQLAAFFGISGEVTENVTADGIKIFSDFMINKERIYSKNDYFGDLDDTNISIPYYSLGAGYEIYAVGLLDNQDELSIEDNDLPPLLWRTTTNNSYVCAVNGDVFNGITMLGVLTGFMAHQGEFYVYPVINAQTISLISYPYFSNENSMVMQKLYSRSSEAAARDLLWPNVIQILKNYGGSYSFFAAPQLDYQDRTGPKENYITFYLREIRKLSGIMGLSLSQVSGNELEDVITQDELFFQKSLPDYDFTALYTGNFSTDEVKHSMNKDFLKNISLVLSDYKEGDKLIGFLNENVLSVKVTLDGYRHETMDDLQMISIENALGMSNTKVDFGRVFYPDSSLDEWNNLSLKWSRGDTYYKDYSVLDMVSVYEMEKRVRRFLALDYTCDYNQNEISITMDHFNEEAYFILCTNNKSIDYVENGTAEKISQTAYLIKAEDAKVRIHMMEENVLEKPKNNKIISSNPE